MLPHVLTDLIVFILRLPFNPGGGSEFETNRPDCILTLRLHFVLKMHFVLRFFNSQVKWCFMVRRQCSELSVATTALLQIPTIVFVHCLHCDTVVCKQLPWQQILCKYLLSSCVAKVAGHIFLVLHIGVELMCTPIHKIIMIYITNIPRSEIL